MSVSSVIWSKITPSQHTLTSEKRRKGENLFLCRILGQKIDL